MATTQPAPSGEHDVPQKKKQDFFVFMKCESGKAYDVGLEIASNKKSIAREVSSISGEWDLLVLIQIPLGAEVGRAVAELFSDIQGIVRTNTVVAYRLFRE